MARVEGLDTRHVTAAAVDAPVEKRDDVNMALLGNCCNHLNSLGKEIGVAKEKNVPSAILRVYLVSIHGLGKAAAFEARRRSEADLATLARQEETSEDHREAGYRRQWGTVASGATRALLSRQGELVANAAGTFVDGASQMATRELEARLAGADPGRVEAARNEADVKRNTVSLTERQIETTSQTVQQAFQRWAASAA